MSKPLCIFKYNNYSGTEYDGNTGKSVVKAIYSVTRFHDQTRVPVIGHRPPDIEALDA